MLVQADDAIVFHQLSGLTDMVCENKFEMSLLQATGDVLGGRKVPSSTESKLSKVCSLSCILVLLLNFALIC